MNEDEVKRDAFTARWCFKTIWMTTKEDSTRRLAEDGYDSVTKIIGDNRVIEGTTPPDPIVDVEEPERPSPSDVGKKLLWYPLATITNEKMPTRGEYANKYPVGAVVHFTAGRSLKGDSDAINTIRGGIANGFCYFCISSDGSVFQSFPLNRWGYHCGKSEWPKLGTSLSNKLVGIEICNAGKLDKNGTSWFGETYPENQTRTVGKEYGEAGKYHKYTEAQEKSLVELLLWLKLNNPIVFDLENVLGHHEISPGRKNDPCGSLSKTMPELRKQLKEMMNVGFINPSVKPLG